MTKLVWDEVDQRRFETGVDRGVLYPENGPGVVWNGLVSIDEAFSGGEVTSYHFDGRKYLDRVSPKTFAATLTAFSAPEEFSSCLGELSVIPGFVLTSQPRSRFGLAYRTMIGTDYKLHLIYNATASSKGRSSKTLSPNATPETRSWSLDAVPPSRENYRPSAHFTIDSRDIASDSLEVIETLLYGSETVAPYLPDMATLFDLVANWDPFRITLNGVTGLHALTSGMGDLYKTSQEGMYKMLPDSRLYPYAAVDGLYRME